MIFEAGETVGDYEIAGVLGIGGMGRVYRVRNLLTNRMEAMKVVHSQTADDAGLSERFLREIRVHASLEHPNIAAVRTALRVKDRVVMIMELVEGASLATLIGQGALAVPTALGIAGQVLAALGYSHGRGVVHRDVKPANILVTPEGAVKVTDFGIARAAGDRQLTGTGMAPGSLYYMSPEQIGGALPDARSDLYSLGVTLYETVTGVRPFRGPTDYAIMQAHLTERPKPPAEISAAIPPAVSDAILRAMSKKPEDRFQSAAEFRDGLQAPADPTASVSAVRTAAAAFDPQELSRVETALAQALGPIARRLVSDASRKAHTLEDLCRGLAEQVPNAADRERFLGSCGHLKATTTGVRPALAAEVLDEARRKLAPFLGPVAKVLVDRASRKARTPAELFALVAAEIPSERDRATFLASAPK
jgi:serine/threonine-protein kinase